MADIDKECDLILDQFHSAVFNLIKMSKKIEPNNPDIEWLHKQASLARSTDHTAIISRSKDKIWAYREKILNHDEKFFLENNFKQFIKDDSNKNFMYSLVNLFKSRFSSLSTEEKDKIWAQAEILLKCVIQYKKLNHEYKS